MIKLTDADKQAFANVWESGEALSRMAERFDMKINAVSSMASRMGLEPRRISEVEAEFRERAPLVEVKCLCGCEKTFKTRDPKGNRISGPCKRSEDWQAGVAYCSLGGEI